MPRWLIVSSSAEGILPRSEREHLVDDYLGTGINLPAAGGWVQVEQAGREQVPDVDRIEVIAVPRTEDKNPQRWTCVVSASDDGRTWRELGKASAEESLASKTFWSPKVLKPAFDVPAKGGARFYRVQLDAPSVTGWRIEGINTFAKGKRVELGGPYDFTSAWKSAGNGAEWIQVDLGAVCTFDRVVLHWIQRAAEGSIRVSDDGERWRTLLPLSATADDYPLPKPASARYVRVQMDRPAAPDGYIMSELQVFGRGGPVPQARPAPAPPPGERQDLVRGSWRLQRDSLVTPWRRGAFAARGRLQGLAAGHRAGYRARELPERGRAAGPELRRQPAADIGLLLLRGLLVPRRVHHRRPGLRREGLAQF